MEFLNVWSIGIGAVALAAPLAIHFLTKPKPVPQHFSTIRFVQEVIEQRKARSRFRDWLILLLRMLCIALLAAAIARPFFASQTTVPLQAEQETQRLILLDVSQSMAAGSGGVSSWSAAVANALKYLEQESGMEANVIFCGTKPTPVFDRLSPNIAALREAIKQASPQAQRADPRAAFEVAASLFQDAAAGRKELVVISDFQRSNWGTLSLDLIPEEVNVQFHNVAAAERANVAITNVHFPKTPIVGQAAELSVQFANYSDRETKVRCKVDLGRLTRTIETSLLPNSSKSVVEVVTFDQVGWYHGQVQLEGNLDVLGEDDRRPVAIRVRPSVDVLLVSREHAEKVPSSSFYLQQALQVSLQSQAMNQYDRESQPDQSGRVLRVRPGEEAVRNWPACDIFVLDHPGALSDESCQFIASQLRRGKGLLYVTAELVDAVNLKKLADLLESDFQPPVEMTAENRGVARKDLFIRSVESREAPFEILGANNAATLFNPVRFAGGLSTKATSEGLQDQVLAELSDTSALLYLTSVGAGQLAVLNADLAQSNWVAHPTFLPVVGELIQSLLTSRLSQTQSEAGEPLVRLLPSTVTDTADLSGLALEGPTPTAGDFGEWKWVTSQNAVVWSWTNPPGAGIYGLAEDGQPVWLVATTIPAVESDLSTLDAEVLTEEISSERHVGYASTESDSDTNDSLWNWLITLCCFGLIAEIIALRFNRM